LTKPDLIKLKAFFPEDDLEWLPKQCRQKKDGTYWVLIIPYITRRAVMERLDSVCGPENWQDDYTPGPNGGVMCRLSIRVNGEWITKCDCADNTNIEAIKGGISDALKRAATKWGVGRYLSQFPKTYGIVSREGKEWTKYKPKSRKDVIVKYFIPPVPDEWLPAFPENDALVELKNEIKAVVAKIPQGILTPRKINWLNQKYKTGFTEGEARRALRRLKQTVRELKVSTSTQCPVQQKKDIEPVKKEESQPIDSGVHFRGEVEGDAHIPESQGHDYRNSWIDNKYI